ncbi:Uncharacterized protein BP5553_08510 [Venustampulla echinocandica]|uniref:P-loop containing nucleoside triphosphate hydrolase n=1 Tax=Venustampulla echinocandica TaxID=2656787 RepID=A0A370TEH2_9HELO|nr:Uncharacterized protein BP5553_08510 [Venustampulla echinocandica]RDL33071.1 Uncharacterized protein BP5553_08510 [Venustampulla echinocandica]
MTSNAAPTAPSDRQEEQSFAQHLHLLRKRPSQDELLETTTSPIFTMPVLKITEKSLSQGAPEPFPQYGLLGGLVDVLQNKEQSILRNELHNDQDPRIFFNVAAPSSTFICGSQGSGKSHTLSCLLENCLSRSDAGPLPKPLTGIVFHYDTFISDDGGSPCEAAFLSSNPQIQRTYQRLNVQVEPLQINDFDLNTKRMIEIMAIDNSETVPLYVHTLYRILREMRVVQQEAGGKFSYREFKRQVMDSGLSPAQLGPLNQRLDTLESFMPRAQVDRTPANTKKKTQKGKHSITKSGWDSKPGWLTIVDLSCPCVTPESACSLFNVCLSLFIEQSMAAGRVIALDEAHKYMGDSAEALTLTNTLLSIIRLQRHLGARIIISTQEPTISPTLLDLCSITIAHRFTSPKWLRSLKGHLAAVATNEPQLESGAECDDADENEHRGSYSKGRAAERIFGEIVRLRVGEALLFAPTAIVGLNFVSDSTTATKTLGTDFIKIRVRNRLTTDGGKSVMAI